MSDFLKAIQLLSRNSEVLSSHCGAHHCTLNRWGSNDKGPGFPQREELEWGVSKISIRIEDGGQKKDQPSISIASLLKQSDSG